MACYVCKECYDCTGHEELDEHPKECSVCGNKEFWRMEDIVPSDEEAKIMRDEGWKP